MLEYLQTAGGLRRGTPPAGAPSSAVPSAPSSVSNPGRSSLPLSRNLAAPAGSPPRDQAAYHGLSLANVAKQGLAVASGIMPSFAAGGHPLSYGPASRALSPASPKNAALCQSNSPAHQPNGVAAQSPARRSVNGNPVEVPHSVGAPWDIERKEGEVEVLTQVAGFTAPQRPTTCGAVDGCRVASNGSSVYGPGSPGSTSTIARAGTTQELRSYPSGQQAYAFPAAVAPQPQANDQFARYYVFDWDNTLCPTDWLCELYGRNGMNLYLSKKPCQALQSPALKPKLDLLQNTVRKLLLKCRDKGEIAIMSNATTVGLIKTLRLLPVIHRTVNELRIAVVSARDMCEPHGLPLEDWKDTALIQMLLEFAGRHANRKLSVMTIGDQDFEHIALQNASEYLQTQFGRDPHPKCIKYVECPSIDTVTKQASIFTELLDQFADEESGTYLMEQDSQMLRA